MPTYSVVMPAWNSERFIRRSIDSVLTQSLDDFELIVVDDGSTDSTRAIAESYGAPVRVYCTSRAGCGGARFAGIREAEGEFISFIDSDDLWLPWTLEEIDRARRSRPGARFVFTNWRHFAEQVPGKSPSAGDLLSESDIGSIDRSPVEHRWYHDIGAAMAGGTIHASPCFGAFHRRAIMGAGPMLERTHCEDNDLVLRLADQGEVVRIMKPVCVLYRCHLGQSTRAVAKTLAGTKMLLEREFKSVYPTSSAGARSRQQYLAHMAIEQCRAGVGSGHIRPASALLLSLLRLGVRCPSGVLREVVKYAIGR